MRWLMNELIGEKFATRFAYNYLYQLCFVSYKALSTSIKLLILDVVELNLSFLRHLFNFDPFFPFSRLVEMD